MVSRSDLHIQQKQSELTEIMLKASTKPILIKLCRKFKWDKVHIEEPKLDKSYGNSYSNVRFVDEKTNTLRPICTELPEQNVWGVSGVWDFGVPRNL